MASTSASSVQKSFKYDVFLSFRGEDTRKTFVDHLYHALTQKGIYTYRDDEEIKKGERISDELIRSIEDSKFYIIVFSKNYASSSWCLDELVKIMECQETNEHTAYPIFYNVEPTEVRKQSGAVEEAFSKHKEKENAVKWREALREAADLAGWELKNTFDGHESKLIQHIVEEISLELRFINSSLDEKLIGMETRVKDVVSSLEIDLDKVVRVIGIWGMGGAGKTTLARAVFDQISYRFEGSSFVENVKENSKNQLGGLKSLQKQVVSDVLNNPHITVKGVSDMKRMMRGRKVLVVLDDVDHRDQLEALAGVPSWFKSGSRVIITTREKQVLVAHDVPENLILGVNLFSHEEANCLFNKYAFGRVIPNQGYEKLSGQVVHYAAGLPLTIKVLGSFLRGKDDLEWIDALARLETIPLMETLDKLELSYESLEYDQKEIFLDVACILKDFKKEEAIRVLESCGFHARIGLRVLEQKCLITVSLSGHLGMHDHIEEMGKHIVRRLHPYEPHKHSRLWIEEEIEDILVKDKGTEAINCIKMFKVNLSVAKKGFQKMGKLRFLFLNCLFAGEYCECHDMSEDKICLPNGLRYLSLYSYPFTCFPDANFQPDNLVGLKIKFSNLKHWEAGEKVIKNLRFIELYYCDLKSLNIGLNMNLEWLHLEGCEHLVELHMPVECLKLKSLHLSYCALKTLNLKGARNLDTLNLIACEELVELHMPIECLKLKYFNLYCSKLKKLNLPRTFNLENLCLNQCKELKELHTASFQFECGYLVDRKLPLEGLKFKGIQLYCNKLKTLDLTQALNLKMLGLVQCENLVELHMPVESLNLNRIYLRHTKLKTLNLKGTRNLETLDLEQCEDLAELHMPVESINLNRICLRHTKLKTLNLKGTQNLETLNLEQCEDMVDLYLPIESLNLNKICLGYTKLKTLNLNGTRNLEALDIEQCAALAELHMPVESLSLNRICLRCTKLKTLNLEWAQNLKALDLEQCEDLTEVHMPVESLNLNRICLRHTKMKTLNLKGTRNLETLNLEQCEDLVELYMPIECLNLNQICLRYTKMKTLNLKWTRNLEMLDLEQCEDLVELHMPDESPNLNRICIQHTKLKILNLKGTRNLKTLDLEQCGELVELHMPDESLNLNWICLRHTKLKILNLKGIQNLKKLDIEQCEDLVELHMPDDHLSINWICIRHAKLKILNLKGARNLETLDLEQCEDLVDLHVPDESLKLNRICIRHTNLKILNLKGAWNLETLDLEQCEDLVDLHMPDESLNLNRICIRHTKLKILNLKGTQNLETLDLEQCGDLVELHMLDERLNLNRICIRHSKLKILNLKGTWNLKTLDLKQCEDLVELHMPVECLNLNWIYIRHTKLKILNLKWTRFLKTLYLEQCEDLVELHMPDESLNLNWIYMRHTKLKILNLKGFWNLETLDLEQCEDLVELHMPDESLNLKWICIRHTKLKILNLNGTWNLETLDLEQCEDLVELHMPDESSKLESINICSSKLRTVDLGLTAQLDLEDGCVRAILVNQRLPKVDSISELTLTAHSLGTSALHHDINLPKFQLHCVYNESLLSPSGNLRQLISFGSCACTNLASSSGSISLRSICRLQRLNKLTLEGFIPEVPKELNQLEYLEELTLSSTKIAHLPDSICMLKHLKLLRFKSCWFLEQLPEDLGRLECLEELYLTECIFLRSIPNSICEAKRLKCFHLPYCVLVDKLPQEVGRLKCLKELNIEGTGISHLPLNTFQLKGLRILGSRWQLGLYDFTSVTQISEYMAFWYV